MSGGPVVIGGTGGSGTRLFAQMVRAAGVHIGTELNLNPSLDQLEIAAFCDRWLDRWLAAPADVEAAMRGELDGVLERHLADRPAASPWGWKEPRCVYLLPFLDSALAGLRFVHVVRDGRDMAFSTNQNQLRKHGAAVLGAEGPIEPRRSIALWALANDGAADFGEALMGGRYLRLRFEDLLDDPGAVAARLAELLGAEVPPVAGAIELERPSSLGSWRGHDRDVVAGLERIAGAVLARFGYV